MKLQRRCVYMGLAVVLCCTALRLFAGNVLGDPKLFQLLVYFQTGRAVLGTSYDTEKPPQSTEAEEEANIQPLTPVWMDYRDCVNVKMENRTTYPLDLEKWAQGDLNWKLRKDAPTVLIYHTHGSESYKNFGQYKETSLCRTTDKAHNMIAVGDLVAKRLEAAGISVIQDKTMHDYPKYAKAYERSRVSAQAYLDKYPSITLVLDLHRDAYADTAGNLVPLTATHNGKQAAKIEIIVGTDATGETHGTWQKNVSTALKLQVALEESFPGICRPMLLRASRYNQDLTPNSLLIEMGTAGGTLEDALAAAEVLAEAIIKIADGVRIVK